ncbi:unnamed protein product [Notodromas monacha]|uniref:C2H2-type domain-containing protein n=1 Tax=Notodromas monacha TaxID=399045 RepID=A0A7R9GB29_9CRUS|nr:unnamed protein product [Notodromas monacha]CAG0915886.1 unnamed protein product [Notodromas monacha]
MTMSTADSTTSGNLSNTEDSLAWSNSSSASTSKPVFANEESNGSWKDDSLEMEVDANGVQCNECNIVLPSRQALRSHVTSVHGYATSCETCGAGFASPAAVKKHHILTPECRSHKCVECPKTFTNAFQLNIHTRRVHLKERLNECPQCNRKFFKVSDLKAHMNVHMGLKKVCDICGKEFHHVSNLTRHRNVHLSIKPYVCKYCGKRFGQVNMLRYHVAAHQSDKPFACVHCDATFNSKTPLQRHIRAQHAEARQNMSSQVRQYYCCVCGESFGLCEEYRAHELGHEERQELTCTECKRFYTDLEEFRGAQVVHNGTQYVVALFDNGVLDPGAAGGDAHVTEPNSGMTSADGLPQHLQLPANMILTDPRQPVVLTEDPGGGGGTALEKFGNALAGMNDAEFAAGLKGSRETTSYVEEIKTEEHILSREDFDAVEGSKELGPGGGGIQLPDGSFGYIQKSATDPNTFVFSAAEPGVPQHQHDQQHTELVEENHFDEEEEDNDETVLDQTTLEQLLIDGGFADETAGMTDQDRFFMNETIEEVASGILHQESPVSENGDDVLVQETGELKCPHCGKRFGRKYTFKQHLGIHDPALHMYRCGLCNKSFAYKTTLKKHCLAVHKCLPDVLMGRGLVTADPSVCGDIVAAVGIKKEKLEDSEDVAQDHGKKIPEKNHRCDTCPKAFAKKHDLVVHQRSHTKEFPFACSGCAVRFNHVSHVKRHEKSCKKLLAVAAAAQKEEEDAAAALAVAATTARNGKDKELFPECFICQLDFDDVAKLLEHMETVHDITVESSKTSGGGVVEVSETLGAS